MAYFEWDDRYKLGIAEIDEQHKKLVKMISGLHDAMSMGKGAQVIGPLLSELAKYTVSHFSLEEKLMTEFKFPKLAQHKSEHEAFIAKVTGFRESYARGTAAMSIDVMNFLKTWLSKHILGTDKEYTPCLVEAKVG